jgi:hypothetical protein
MPRSRAEAWSAPRITSTGTTCGGKNSGRSRGSLAVHCCPPRPWSALPRSGPRGPSTGPLTRTFVLIRATLLTLAPTIRRVPVLATRPQSRVSSRGVVQRSPLHRIDPGVRLPEAFELRVSAGPGSHCCSPASFGMGTPNPIQRAVVVVLHHLDGLLLRDLAALLHAASDPGVHSVSSCRETGFPAMHLLPFEAFPPPTATKARTNPCSRGPASPLRPSPAAAFTANLAPSPFFSSDFGRGFPHSRPDEPGPRGLAPSSGPLRGRTFPLARTRCSLGLGRLARPRNSPVPSPRTGRAVRRDHAHELPTSRQRPFRRMTPSV